MSKLRFFLTLFFALALSVGSQDAVAVSADSCHGIQKSIKRARAKFFHHNKASKSKLNKKQARKLLKRLKNLKAIKAEQGCGAPVVLPPPPVGGEVCVQMIVCRIIDGEVKVWPDPCAAAAEREDYESLPFC